MIVVPVVVVVAVFVVVVVVNVVVGTNSERRRRMKRGKVCTCVCVCVVVYGGCGVVECARVGVWCVGWVSVCVRVCFVGVCWVVWLVCWGVLV